MPDLPMLVGSFIVVASGIYTLYRERVAGRSKPVTETTRRIHGGRRIMMMDGTFQSEQVKPPSMATLIIATSVGPLALNVFLPSLPGMARYFAVDYGVVQLALSLYLVAMALLQLALGPASDRYGRRPVLLASLLIFLTATFAAIFSPSVHFLLACRILQAFAASGIVLSRAIVRDTVDTEDAASKIGYITMGMSVTPMIAPFIGGYSGRDLRLEGEFLADLCLRPCGAHRRLCRSG